MTEQINDYAEPVIKIQKSIKHLESLCRLKRMEEVLEEIPNAELQLCKLRSSAYAEIQKQINIQKSQEK